jgi:hypothetical protein
MLSSLFEFHARDKVMGVEVTCRLLAQIAFAEKIALLNNCVVASATRFVSRGHNWNGASMPVSKRQEPATLEPCAAVRGPQSCVMELSCHSPVVALSEKAGAGRLAADMSMG